MRFWQPALLVTGLVFALGCPPVNSSPCSADSECDGGRCRQGACGPVCLADPDCGSAQVCSKGSCVPAPECSKDGDCAQGFSCTHGQCLCANDTACATNQSCIQGKCQAKTPCKTDNDCAAIGERCEIVSGTCIPPCTLPTDCAPGLNPALAAALYFCQQGDCLRNCVNDATCGPNFICVAGECQAAQCKTFTDCPTGQYCTSATFGRCTPYQTCSSTSECAANFQCQAFGQLQCPPGFPCQEQICQELPLCLVDSDCALAGGLQPDAGVWYCGDGHCQRSAACPSGAGCDAGQVCIASVCVPGGCRGLTDCTPPQACEGGACISPPAPGDIAKYALTPGSALLEVGDTLQFTLLAYRLDGTSFPMATAAFSAADGGVATVTPAGLATARSAGQVTVSAQVTGAFGSPATSSLTVVAAPASAKRVTVVDAASRAPLAGVKILGCDSPPATGACPSPVEVTTDVNGAAGFAFNGITSSFSAASPALRADGLPTYNRVSIAQTAASDVLIPMSYNWVHGAGGFNGLVDFSNVHTTGTYWAGLMVLSEGDPTDVDLRLLLGDSFNVSLPVIPQTVPVPGAVVLYTSIGFGLPNEIKGRSYGLGQAGRRHAVAFAGRGNSAQLADIRSLNVLGYTGYMDYAVGAFEQVPHLPLVPDTTDLNNNGLCSNPQKCPAGTEDIPDYANFAGLSLQPQAQQAVRTQVTVPNVPGTLDTVLLASVTASAEEGLLPLGFSSQAAGAPGSDGTRPVPSVVLQSGAPYGGVEVGQPGVWAIALSIAGATTSTGQGNLTARIARSPVLPAKVALPAFLPLPDGSSFAVDTRTFSPGQPQWNAIASGGASLAKVELTGSQAGHVMYFPLQGNQTAIRFPDSPLDVPGADPAAESTAVLSVTALSLGGTTATDILGLPGPNLTDLPTVLDGYSRFDH